MYYFIPHSVILLSVLGMAFIVYKKIGAILQFPQKPEQIIPEEKLVRQSWEKIKELTLALKRKSWGPALLSWFEKRLRQLRIVFLKIDNLIQKVLERAKDKSQTWSVRSRAWSEKKRLDKLDRIKVLEKRDKIEFMEMIEEGEAEKKEDGPAAKKIDRETEEKKAFLESEKEYINRVAENPRDKNAYLELGRLYLEQNNLEDAQSSFLQVLKLEAKNEEAQSLLAQVEEKLANR